MKASACLIFGEYNALIYGGFDSFLVVVAGICAVPIINANL